MYKHRRHSRLQSLLPLAHIHKIVVSGTKARARRCLACLRGSITLLLPVRQSLDEAVVLLHTHTDNLDIYSGSNLGLDHDYNYKLLIIITETTVITNLTLNLTN